MQQDVGMLLPEIDWAEEWRKSEALVGKGDNPAYWSERAKTFPVVGQHSSYVDDFLALADIQPGESVLDMGCGNGALAIPLACAGHKVIAADFAQGMLDVLQRDLGAGAPNADVKLLSWSDDWQAAGLSKGCVDVALSSRSMATQDIRESLEKLSWVARDRACVTLPTAFSPRADERILRAIGLDSKTRGTYLYAFMVLHQMGYRPEVRYIESTRDDSYDSAEEAYESLQKMVTDSHYTYSEEESAAALERLRAWIPDNLIDNPQVGLPDEKGKPQKRFCLREPRKIIWAFLTWKIEG